jgi:hypothetical protein
LIVAQNFSDPDSGRCLQTPFELICTDNHHIDL